MKYHPILNSNSGISAAAFDAETNEIFLRFPNATYGYRPDNAEQHFENLVNVKRYAESLNEEEKAEIQQNVNYTLGSEGSYCLKNFVGPRKEPFPFLKLTPEDAVKVWAGMSGVSISTEPCGEAETL